MITHEQAVRLGMSLKPVMNTDGFKVSVEVMQEEFHRAVFDSQPHQQDSREEAYRQAKALDDLIATFNSFVAVYEAQALENGASDED